jgi:solute carrier family 6 amino acid transporter-like protein 5/7/9/14
MDVAPLWSFLFFFMLINLALSSICGGVQTFIAFVLDEKPSLAKYKQYIVVVGCCLFFVCGLPMCTTGGIHLFTVFDKKCTSSLLLLCLIEVLLVAWIYGVDRFLANIADMSMRLPKPLRLYWKIMWMFISPIILATIVILAWVEPTPLRYGDEGDPKSYLYPDSVQAFGWIMEFLPTVIALVYPFWVIKRYRDKGYSGSMLLKRIFQPADSWEKTTGSAVMNAGKINEAFDEHIYSNTAKQSEENLTEL